MDLFYRYFILPMEARTGYNPVNTVTYGLILVIGVYLVRKKLGSKINEDLVLAYVPFIVLSGILRTYEDFHIVPRTYITISPGYYIIMVLLGIMELAILGEPRRIALINIFASVIITVPLLSHSSVLFPAVFLPTLPLLLDMDSKKKVEASFVLGVLLDAFATAYGVGACGLYEQHFLPRALLSAHPLLFPLLKIPLALAVVWALRREKDGTWRNTLYLALMSITMGPGVRDMVVVSKTC